MMQHSHQQLPLPEEIHNPHYQEYLKLSQKRWMFSDLLMMNKEQTILTNNKQKIQVLNLLYHCYRTAAEALHAFYIERKPELFDAHVGESACQIRAIKLAEMQIGIDLKISTEALLRGRKFEALAQKILKLKSCANSKRGKLSLNKFVESHNIDIIIENEELFLLTCFVLTEYKENMDIDTDIINISKFSDRWLISRTQCRKLLKCFQKIASFISISYVFKNTRHDYMLSHMLAYQLQKEESSRWVLPALEVTQVLMQSISQYQLPVHFYAYNLGDREYLKRPYHFIYYNGLFQSISDKVLGSIRRHSPVISIESFFLYSGSNKKYCALLKSLNHYNVDYIINCNISSHRQYPGELLQAFSLSPYLPHKNDIDINYLYEKECRLRDLQANSLLHGFNKRLPTLLALTHISCISSNLLFHLGCV